jgi:hypothetical protein
MSPGYSHHRSLHPAVDPHGHGSLLGSLDSFLGTTAGAGRRPLVDLSHESWSDLSSRSPTKEDTLVGHLGRSRGALNRPAHRGGSTLDDAKRKFDGAGHGSRGSILQV